MKNKTAIKLGFIGSLLCLCYSLIWFIEFTMNGSGGITVLGFIPAPILYVVELVGGAFLSVFFFSTLKRIGTSQNQGEPTESTTVTNANENQTFPSTPDFKLANEEGIIGLIIGVVLYASVYVNELPSINIKESGDQILGGLTIAALVNSIVGVARSSKRYQKKIAVTGLILNCITTASFILAIIRFYA